MAAPGRRGESLSLSSYYKRQRAWRAWPVVFDALPPLRGQTVLDLACGVGDLAAELVARGARVIGVDLNEELLGEARSRGLANAEFRSGDLRSLPDLGVAADGLWCSFAAAYFTDFPPTLASWSAKLRPGAWTALTEIDDLFGHGPLGERTKELLAGYARDALAAGRYDFHMGGKLRDCLEASGFEVSRILTLDDQELSFHGAASPEVVDAWRARLDGMTLLRDFCGSDFARVREEFLGCLARTDHRSTAKVICCIATKERGGAPRADARIIADG
jgi:SAM-dependent methyltransferase